MKTLDDELFDIYCQDGKTVIASLREIYEKGRADAIDEFVKELEFRFFDDGLWEAVTKYDVLEIQEQLKEQKSGAKTDIEKLDAEIRAVERRKLLNWLDDNDALGTEVYDSKHYCFSHQRLSVEEVLQDYEDSLKGGQNNV